MRQVVSAESFSSTFIKTLSTFQAGILEAAADEEPFIVLEVLEGDSSFWDYRETMILVDLGFLEDVTHRYKELVEDAYMKYRRRFRVLYATPDTVKLFGSSIKRTVN